MQIKKNTLTGVLVIGVVLLMNACVMVVNDSETRTKPHNSPPTVYWYYYPNERVYYHATGRYYYYPDGQNWRRAKQLPPGWVISQEDRVLLKASGMPYTQHASHRQKYPARNTAANPPGKGNHAGRANHPHPQPEDLPDARQASHENKASKPENADPDSRGQAKGRQQSGFDRKVDSRLARTGKKIPPQYSRRNPEAVSGHINSTEAPGNPRRSTANGHEVRLNHDQRTGTMPNPDNGKAASNQSNNKPHNDQSGHERTGPANDRKHNDRQAKPAERSLHETGHGNVKDERESADVKNSGSKGKGKAGSQQQPHDTATGAQPGSETASRGDDSSQPSGSDNRQDSHAATIKQARQPGHGDRKNRQTGSYKQGDDSEPDADMPSADDKVVKWNTHPAD